MVLFKFRPGGRSPKGFRDERRNLQVNLLFNFGFPEVMRNQSLRQLGRIVPRGQTGFVQLRRRGPVHRNPFHGHDLQSIPGPEVDPGQQERALHEQRRGKRVGQAGLPQRLGVARAERCVMAINEWG